jgi:hypothetical protein
MRSAYIIDQELRCLGAVWQCVRAHGVQPSTRRVDELLDERLVQMLEAPLSSSGEESLR